MSQCIITCECRAIISYTRQKRTVKDVKARREKPRREEALRRTETPKRYGDPRAESSLMHASASHNSVRTLYNDSPLASDMGMPFEP